MIGRLGVLYAFSTCDIFSLTVSLLGHNPILSQGRSVQSRGLSILTYFISTINTNTFKMKISNTNANRCDPGLSWTN